MTSEMTLNEYQQWTQETRQWDPKWNLIYPALGLAGEAGEVADQVKKVIRNDGGNVTADRREKIIDELGDVLYYLANVAYDLNVNLDDVARRNREKLLQRLKDNQIKGR